MFLYFLYFFERVKGEYTQNIVKIIYKTTLEELLSLTLYSLTMNHDFEFFRIFFLHVMLRASSFEKITHPSCTLKEATLQCMRCEGKCF